MRAPLSVSPAQVKWDAQIAPSLEGSPVGRSEIPISRSGLRLVETIFAQEQKSFRRRARGGRSADTSGKADSLTGRASRVIYPLGEIITNGAQPERKAGASLSPLGATCHARRAGGMTP